jgi:hypothetical protein
MIGDERFTIPLAQHRDRCIVLIVVLTYEADVTDYISG